MVDSEPHSFLIKEFEHFFECAVTPGPFKSEKCFKIEGAGESDW